MIKIKVDPKTTRALKRMVESATNLKEACDKAMLTKAQRILRKAWIEGQKDLLNMEARRLAQWLKAQRN